MSVRDINKVHKRYTVYFSIAVLITLSLCLAANVLMDPLWYFSGNGFSNVNFAFNERLSKTNRFLKNIGDYDCIIFGSSRTTVLNEHHIEHHKCFNYAFSGGRIEEYLSFASYVINKGFSPELVIIGVDDINFVNNNGPLTIPDFITGNTSPPSFIKSYLSFDALKFSFRLLMNNSPLPRYYDNHFTGRILDTAPEYRPAMVYPDNNFISMTNDQLNNILTHESPAKLTIRLDAVQKYYRLMKLFKDAEVIAYVPPISVQNISSKSVTELSGYLDSLFRISQFIRPFYDFSFPSEITYNDSNTYDGSHYSTRVNRLIADRLNNKSVSFGVRLDSMDKENYYMSFRIALKNILASR